MTDYVSYDIMTVMKIIVSGRYTMGSVIMVGLMDLIHMVFG